MEQYIGLTEEEAIKKIQADGVFTARVMERNGESFFGTCDYDTTRINLIIEESKVAKAYLG